MMLLDVETGGEASPKASNTNSRTSDEIAICPLFIIHNDYYSLRSELLVAGMDISRCILVLDTSISATSNLEQRE